MNQYNSEGLMKYLYKACTQATVIISPIRILQNNCLAHCQALLSSASSLLISHHNILVIIAVTLHYIVRIPTWILILKKVESTCLCDTMSTLSCLEFISIMENQRTCEMIWKTILSILMTYSPHKCSQDKPYTQNTLEFA